MLYILIYLIIGMIYSGIMFPSIIRSSCKEYPQHQEMVLVIGLVVMALFAPFWPLLLTAKLAKRKEVATHG